MYNFGKHILNYLKDKEYKYNINVIESSIIDVDTSFRLFCESSDNHHSFTQRLFYNPNITADFLLKNKSDNSFFVDSEKMSFSSLITQNDIDQHPELDNMWNVFSLLQNPKISPMFVMRHFREQIMTKNLAYVNRCIIFNKSCSLKLLNNLSIPLTKNELMYFVSSDTLQNQDFEHLMKIVTSENEIFKKYEYSIYKYYSKNKNLNIEYLINNLEI